MEAEYRTKRTFLIRLPHGGDLLESINGICREKRIESGVISVIGAVKSAVVGYYHQEKKEYQAISLERPLEIASCTGNISIKNDSTPIAHAHIVLSDEAGIAAGGHLMPGTEIFAAEAVINELEGQPLIRQQKDSLTGLPLWSGVKSV
jgi:predicted DNA-binding protein with PD1-like motif